MRTFKSLPVLLAVGLTAATFGMSAPAQADSATLKDAPNDVRVTTVTDPNIDPVVAIDPDNARVDITKAVIKHGLRRVKVVVHVRDLRARKLPALQVVFKTNAGIYVGLLTKDPLVGTQLDLVTPDPKAGLTHCRGSRQSFKSALDVASFSLPRRCLGNPRWIRAQAGLSDVAFVEGATPEQFTVISFDDVAGPTGKVPPLPTKNSTTPKLFRG